jgi:transcription elongation GreA/GreB family factor
VEFYDWDPKSLVPPIAADLLGLKQGDSILWTVDYAKVKVSVSKATKPRK